MRVILFLCAGIFITSFIITMVSYAFLFSRPEDYKILDILKDNPKALMFLVHFPGILIVALTGVSIAWSSKAQAAYQRVKRIKKEANLFWFVIGSVISVACFALFYMAFAAGYLLPRRLNVEFSLKYVIISGVLAGMIIQAIPSVIIRTIDRAFRKYFYREHYLHLHFPTSRLGLLYLAYKYRNVQQFPHGPEYLWREQVDLLAAKAKKGNDRAIEQLFNWLKDERIRGYSMACRSLLLCGEKTLPAVINILQGDDIMWKLWVLKSLVDHWPPKTIEKIKSLLIELTQKDDNESVNLNAALILCWNELCPKDQLQKMLDRLKGLYSEDEYEIKEIEDYLKEDSSQNEPEDDETECD